MRSSVMTTNLIQIEQTSKSLKIHIAISVMMIFLGVLGTVISMIISNSTLVIMCLISAIAGIPYFIIFKIIIWWRHK